MNVPGILWRQILHAGAGNAKDGLPADRWPGRWRKDVTVAESPPPGFRYDPMAFVERSETLDLLQRDARSLERALNDAGLKADSGSLEFNLRGDGDAQAEGGERDTDFTNGTIALPGEEQGEASLTESGPVPQIVPDGRLNIQV